MTKDRFRDDEGDICRLTKTDLEIFRENFPSTKVTVLNDAILYHSIPEGQSHKMQNEARDLIEKLKLNLEVVANKHSALFSDTFLIKENG